MLDNKLGLFLVVFITVLIGITLLSSLSDDIASATTISEAIYEDITISSAAGTTAQDDLTAVSYFGNHTFNTSIDTIEINDEINWTRPGAISVAGMNFTDDVYQISYSYEDDEYIADGTSRTLIKLIKLFFALAILIVGFVWIRKIFDDMF